MVDTVRNFVLVVPSHEAEVAADMLWAWGVVALEERDLATGDVELWTSLGDSSDEADDLIAGLPAAWRWRYVDVDASVTETWRAFARPVRVLPDLVYVPAWIEHTPAPGETAISIEPGATFGLGDHPTTLLSARALAACLATRSSASVLDVGCGSGVLAVTACHLGAARAVGIDISPASPSVGADNAARNGVADRVSISCEPLAGITETFDVVVANILAPALIELAPDLRRVMAPGAQLVLSGLLDGRYEHVIAELDRHGRALELQSVARLDGWVALTLA